MDLKKEDGKLDTLHNVHKLDIVPEMNADTQELFAMARDQLRHCGEHIIVKDSSPSWGGDTGFRYPI
jgi:hypothetical protein